MFKAIYISFILIVLAGGYMSWGIWQKARLLAGKSAIVGKDVDRIRQQLHDVSSLFVRPLPAVQVSYRKAYESFRWLGDVWGIKYDFEIQGMHGHGSLDSALKPSRFYGVANLEAKAIFFQIQDEDQYKQILKALSDLEGSLPLEITKVQVSSQSLEVDMRIYG